MSRARFVFQVDVTVESENYTRSSARNALLRILAKAELDGKIISFGVNSGRVVGK